LPLPAGVADERMEPGTTAAHTPSMTRASAAASTAILVLALAACTSASPKSCDGKCPASELPRFAVHLTVDGQALAVAHGTARATMTVGRPVALSLSIDRANGVAVRDVYLFVNSTPWTDGPGAPSGRVKILAHHADPLPPGQTVVADWTPSPLFGTTKLKITARFDLGNIGTAATAAELRLIS
jgi:hypothetical protein